MEITNKIKAKIFAQYLEQTCQTMTRQSQGEGLPFKFLKGELKEIDLGMVDDFIGLLLENETNITNHTNYNTDQCKLILKPLSAITDEDAIEVLNILMGRKGSYYKDWHINMQEQWLKIIKLELTENFGSTQLKILPYFKNMFMVNQFLQSKGYDLPNFLLDGKTLFESNLCIYE